MKEHEAKAEMQGKIAQILEKEIRGWLKSPEDKLEDFKSPERIISYWSRVNAVLVGGANIIPGPAGWVAALPTLIVEIRNQVKMIRDIAVFYKKEDKLDTQLVLTMLAINTASAGGKLLVFRGSNILIKRATAKLIQKILQRLSIRLTQKIIARFVAALVPFLGSMVLGGWAYATTDSIGKLAKNIFSKDISYSEETIDDDAFEDSPDVEDTSEQKLYEIALNTGKAMVEMMLADDDVSKEELEIVNNSIRKHSQLIPDSDLFKNLASDIDKYSNEYTKTRISTLDYNVFSGNEDAKQSLILVLIAVAKASDGVCLEEIRYLEQICKKIGYDYNNAIVLMQSI